MIARTTHVSSEIRARSLFAEANNTKCSELESSSTTIAELQLAGCPASLVKLNINDDLYKIRLTNKWHLDIYVPICWDCQAYNHGWYCACWLKLESQASEFVKYSETEKYILMDYNFTYFYANTLNQEHVWNGEDDPYGKVGSCGGVEYTFSQ